MAKHAPGSTRSPQASPWLLSIGFILLAPGGSLAGDWFDPPSREVMGIASVLDTIVEDPSFLAEDRPSLDNSVEQPDQQQPKATEPEPNEPTQSEPQGTGSQKNASKKAEPEQEVDGQSEEASTFVGYDRGFVVANDGTEALTAGEFPFLLRLSSWFQLRHTLFDSDGPNDDQNTISLERLRINFSGHVYTPDLHYFIKLDGNSDRSSEVVFLDYFVSYDVGHSLFGWKENRLGIRAGKWKVPLNRSRRESGQRLQFSDRATSSLFFDLNRSIGFGFYGQIGDWAVPVHFETAVFNGFQTGNTSTNRDAGLDHNLAWSLRVFSDLLGEFGNDGEPDLSYHKLPSLRVGAAVAWSHIDADGNSEFSNPRVVDSGVTLSSLLPAGVDQYDVWLATVDAQLKYLGFSLIAEYYQRNVTDFRGGAVPSLFDHGFNLQMGYFLHPEKLELIARWSRIVGDSEALGRFDQSFDEVAGGFVWYIKGHNAKLNFDLTHVNGVPLSSSRADLRPSDVGWLMRTQFQLAF